MQTMIRIARAVAGLGVLGCLSLGSMSAADATTCPFGDNKLRLSGLCASQAARLMPAKDPNWAQTLQAHGCTAVINEASFVHGALLYWAASCKGKVAQLEMRVMGSGAELYVTQSHVRSHGKPDKAGELSTGINRPMQAYITDRARTEMEHFSKNAFTKRQINRCKAYKRPDIGPNIYLVDEYAPNQQPTGDAAYRDACGRYGLTADSFSYWRAGPTYTWFFNGRSQDALKDFDRSSLALVARNKAGQWIRVQKPGKLMEEAMISADAYQLASIAGTPGARETLYGTASGYKVYRGVIAGKVRYCVAERRFDQTALRIGYDGGQWQVAVPYEVKPDYYGGYQIDGKGRGMSGTAGNGWTFWWLGAAELQMLRNGNELVMDIARASLDFPLAGSWAAISKVEECVHRKGQRPR